MNPQAIHAGLAGEKTFQIRVAVSMMITLAGLRLLFLVGFVHGPENILLNALNIFTAVIFISYIKNKSNLKGN